MTDATAGDFLALTHQQMLSALGALPQRQLSGTERDAVIQSLQPLLHQVDRHLGDRAAGGRYARPASGDAERAAAIQQTLAAGRNALRRSLGPGGAPRPPAGAATTVEAACAHLRDAARSLGIAADLMATHHSVNGTPASPYGELLASRAGQAYVAARMAETIDAVGAVGAAIARRSSPNAQLTLVNMTVGLNRLARVSVDLSLASRDAALSLDALPSAAGRTPVPLAPDETQADRLARIAAGADRVVVLAYQAPRSTAPFSAAALRGSADTLALTHLIAGNALRSVAESLPVSAAESLTGAANSLRAAAQAWKAVGHVWRRIVDLDDGPGRPGRGHPVQTEIELLALRTGRLVYGESWTPTDRPTAPAAHRLLDQGADALVDVLRRIPSASAALADSAPAITARIAVLVTDDGQHHTGARRWGPVAPAQLNAITEAYRQAHRASREAEAAVGDLAYAAAAAPSVRGALDRAADRTRLADPDTAELSGWRTLAQASTPNPQRPPAWRALDAASAPRAREREHGPRPEQDHGPER